MPSRYEEIPTAMDRHVVEMLESLASMSARAAGMLQLWSDYEQSQAVNRAETYWFGVRPKEREQHARGGVFNSGRLISGGGNAAG
jgi:hypothetical protein